MKNVKFPTLMPTAEPFFFPGNRTGCLLIHGFTGTPKEMRQLGVHLSNQGCTVLGIRLPGHATQLQDMLRMRWRDWIASLEDGWQILSGCTDQIFIMGLSMGGVLALCFSAHAPVAGVVGMSTPHHFPKDLRVPMIKPISLYQRFQRKGLPNWYDVEAYQDHVSYSSQPTRGLAELRDLIGEMQSALPQIKAPALLIYSRHDRTVRAEDGHMEAIYAALGSQEKQTLWIENSGHVITSDAQRETVFQAVLSFISRYSRLPAV